MLEQHYLQECAGEITVDGRASWEDDGTMWEQKSDIETNPLDPADVQNDGGVCTER